MRASITASMSRPSSRWAKRSRTSAASSGGSHGSSGSRSSARRSSSAWRPASPSTKPPPIVPASSVPESAVAVSASGVSTTCARKSASRNTSSGIAGRAPGSAAAWASHASVGRRRGATSEVSASSTGRPAPPRDTRPVRRRVASPGQDRRELADACVGGLQVDRAAQPAERGAGKTRCLGGEVDAESAARSRGRAAARAARRRGRCGWSPAPEPVAGGRGALDGASAHRRRRRRAADVHRQAVGRRQAVGGRDAALGR